MQASSFLQMTVAEIGRGAGFDGLAVMLAAGEGRPGAG